MDNEEDFKLSSYFYDLPQDCIAQTPPCKRDEAKLLVLKKDDSTAFTDSKFKNIVSFLPENSLLVANNTKVMPARLFGKKESGGKIELLILTPLPLIIEQTQKNGKNQAIIECLLRPAAKINHDSSLSFGEMIKLKPLDSQGFGLHKAILEWKGDLAENILASGLLPLPPYIKRPANSSDFDNYQTVYAKNTGAIAAPTAGLHFTKNLQEELCNKGHDWTEITLHAGYGTFSPVRCPDIRNHKIHSEYVNINEEAARKINKALLNKRPVIAIGTTSLRALEGVWQKYGKIAEFSGNVDIFIYPGKKINVASSLITNFHLPESTLLMLVSALAGRKRILKACEYAITHGYKFFSYGDAMLIL